MARGNQQSHPDRAQPGSDPETRYSLLARGYKRHPGPQ